MAGPIEITGAQQFGNLSRVLKAQAPALRRGYLAGIRRATAPAKTAIPESARAKLPRRGGLNEYVATGLKVTTRTSLSGPMATVRIVATDPPRHDIRAMDAGLVRHPTFGNRQVWRQQRIEPGFFTEPCMALRPGARKAIAVETDRVLAQIARAAY